MKPISLEEVVQMSNCNRTPDQEEFAEEVATGAKHVAHKVAHEVKDLAADVEHGAKKSCMAWTM